MKISQIQFKEQFLQTQCSIFYRVKINEQNFILKETDNEAWIQSKIIASYENCRLLSELDSIVKIYDYSLNDNKTFLLMEDLNDYENLLKINDPSQEFRDKIKDQILMLFENIWNRNLLNYDFTIINFMVKDEKIKMIDLEFIESLDLLNLSKVLWFCERLDIVKNWCNSSFKEFDKIKENVIMRWSYSKLI